MSFSATARLVLFATVLLLLMANTAAEITSIEHGGEGTKRKSVDAIDLKHGPILRSATTPVKELETKRFLKGSATIPLKDLEMKRNLKGKSTTQCKPKDEPFRLVHLDSETDLCYRGCGIDPFEIVAGTKASKSAKQCCENNPISTRDEACLHFDDACHDGVNDAICEKQLFYHYDKFPLTSGFAEYSQVFVVAVLLQEIIF
jgi:hypothetical protein